MFYIIQVATSGKHFYLTIKKQSGRNKSKKIELHAAFIADNGVYKVNNDQGMAIRNSNKVWNADNLENVAKALLNFFLTSKFASSTNWTSFWHVKNVGESTKVYKMYDCSLDFLERNVKLYSSQKSD